jgi:hypothetical protein
MMNVKCIWLLLAATSGTMLAAQELRIGVVDVVELPAIMTGQSDTSWYLEFREEWTISGDRAAIFKSVNSYTVHDLRDPHADKDSLQSAFGAFMRQLLLAGGNSRFREITHEFLLMDDQDTTLEMIRAGLSSLVADNSAMADHFNLRDQLLSVYFHEEWTVDPVSYQITKRVLGITPVVWQRRETAEGEPVNDADTGLPVYYKMNLERIPLRNR